ncbi:ATP-binding protein [Sphingomonas bacterium]|uniref:ATP-binding protein n=1 Tax=Sphingomonas bacterium TaxID=1895847 RepID=UPI00157600D0|nr:ATP-binding protein [Sphingomonas bacterium]
MPQLDIIPTASALLQSLRGLGYSPETALADLVDNSIAAGAGVISLDIEWNDGDPRIILLDDGRGMAPDKLEEAMRFGGVGPSVDRDPDDLGRFGLGLKTASLSQCRRLTVISRQDGITHSMMWDVDEVRRTDRWTVQTEVMPIGIKQLTTLERNVSGTMLVLEAMDEIGGLYGLDEEGFYAKIQDVRAHFAMVFHRFLSLDARRLAIVVNERAVEGWDPMLRTHPATRTLAAGRVGSGSAGVHVAPFVLPHRDRFANEAEYAAAGGPGSWAERQGFYVYRAKRLVVAGSWLGLGGSRAWTKEESSRLARIAVDLPSKADAAWRIDVRKSAARPPAAMRARLSGIGATCREVAREVFAWRGGNVRGPSRPADVAGLWVEERLSGKRRYRIARDHPVITRLSDPATFDPGLFSAALTLIERSVPIERIWLDVSEGADEATAQEPVDPALVDELALVLRSSAKGASEDLLDALLKTLRIDTPAVRARVLVHLKEHP